MKENQLNKYVYKPRKTLRFYCLCKALALWKALFLRFNAYEMMDGIILNTQRHSHMCLSKCKCTLEGLFDMHVTGIRIAA